MTPGGWRLMMLALGKLPELILLVKTNDWHHHPMKEKQVMQTPDMLINTSESSEETPGAKQMHQLVN